MAAVEPLDSDGALSRPLPGPSQTPPGLPLPDPYPEYLVCPHCGEPEVEVWCYQESGPCHNCGKMVEKARPSCFGTSPLCCGAPAPTGGQKAAKPS
jgi:hypothetical protein